MNPNRRALAGRRSSRSSYLARALGLAALCSVSWTVVAFAATMPTFVRSTGPAGLDGSYSAPGVYGPGVAVVDFDGDGDLDMFVPNDLSGHKLYENQGNGTFVDIAASVGLNFTTELPPFEDRTHPFELDPTAMMPVFLDTDNDGDRDFFLTCWNSYNRFFENVDGTYVDRTAESGLDIVGHSATAAFGDYNRDGRLDVYIADWGGVDHLFRNDGDNRWTDVSNTAGIYEGLPQVAQPGWCAIWFDHDEDLWPELYVGNDYGLPNFFYRNLGGQFVESARDHFPELRDPDRTLDDGNATMGQALGDFDHDGDYDIFVANSLVNDLYRRDGDEYFDLMEDATMVGPGGLLNNLKNNDIGWFCDWPDVDNDGWVDLFLVNGYIRLCLYDDPLHPDCSGEGQREQPNILWMNKGDGSFDRVTDQAGLTDLGWGKAAGIADFDGDGDLDIFVTNSGSVTEPSEHAFWMNDTPAVDQGNWLIVTLEGTTSNREGIGAKVRVRADGMLHMRDRIHSTGYLSQSPEEIHFGLGGAAVVDLLRVIWPSGRVDVWQDVPVNTRQHLVEGSSQGVPARAAPTLAVAPHADGVELIWSVANGDDWEGFRVHRAENGAWSGTRAEIAAEPGRDSYRWVDRDVADGRDYRYRVEAVASDASIESEMASIRVNLHGPRLAVLPARPNPFNPRTVLRYRVPEDAAFVRLRIIDALGREVARLSPTLGPGWQSSVWNGTDAHGREVASGSYRFVVEVDGRADTTPLTLVR